MAVNDGRDSELPAVEQSVRDKIHRPAIIDAGDLGTPRSVASGTSAFRCLYTQGEPFLAIEPVNPLVGEIEEAITDELNFIATMKAKGR